MPHRKMNRINNRKFQYGCQMQDRLKLITAIDQLIIEISNVSPIIKQLHLGNKINKYKSIYHNKNYMVAKNTNDLYQKKKKCLNLINTDVINRDISCS